MKQSTLREIFRLPVKDRIHLVQQVLESIAMEQEDDYKLTAAQKKELLRRMKESREHPERYIPWETVKAELARKYK